MAGAIDGHYMQFLADMADDAPLHQDAEVLYWETLTNARRVIDSVSQASNVGLVDAQEPPTKIYTEAPLCPQDDLGHAYDPLYMDKTDGMIFVVYTVKQKSQEVVAWLTKIDNTRAQFSISTQKLDYGNKHRYHPVHNGTHQLGHLHHISSTLKPRTKNKDSRVEDVRNVYYLYRRAFQNDAAAGEGQNQLPYKCEDDLILYVLRQKERGPDRSRKRQVDTRGNEFLVRLGPSSQAGGAAASGRGGRGADGNDNLQVARVSPEESALSAREIIEKVLVS